MSFSAGVPTTIDLPGATGAYCYVQRYAEDRWLLAAHEQPAILVDAGGNFQAEFYFEGLVHGLQTSAAGSFRVAYDEQGRAWGGLACFDADGEYLVDFDALVTGDPVTCGLWMVYAMNVVGEDAYLYPYTDFPLVRAGKDAIRTCWRKMPIAFANAFAVSESHALFCKDRADDQRLMLVDLRGRPEDWRTVHAERGPYRCHDGFLEATTLEAVGEDGRPLSFLVAAARGPVMCLFNTEEIFTLALPDVVADRSGLEPALASPDPATGLEPCLSPPTS